MKKNVLILSSSPRRNGNSDLLCDRFYTNYALHLQCIDDILDDTTFKPLSLRKNHGYASVVLMYYSDFKVVLSYQVVFIRLRYP